jgi:hypothetical protein
MQKVPSPIPISTCNEYEEANLVFFANILSIILSDPGKMPEPVPKHALGVVKNEIIPSLCERILNCITRGNISIFQHLLERPKKPKVAQPYI